MPRGCRGLSMVVLGTRVCFANVVPECNWQCRVLSNEILGPAGHEGKWFTVHTSSQLAATVEKAVVAGLRGRRLVKLEIEDSRVAS